MKNLNPFKKFAKTPAALITNGGKNAVIYTRVSTKEQAETNKSLDTQKKYCEEFAVKHNFKVLGCFGGTYESAASDERKKFQEMLKYVEKSKEKISFIIVYSFDRFSRTGANAIYITDQLKNKGILVVSVMQGAMSDSPTETFQRNMYFLFSQLDNDQRRQKTIDGMYEKLKRGYWMGRPPIGYDMIKLTREQSIEEQKITPNAKGEIIKKMFHWKADEGLTNIQIVERCNAMGFKIAMPRLTEIFQNPFYCGIMSHKTLKDEVVYGNHEPLISEELFLRANELTNKHRHGYKMKFEDENIPMKGFIRCTCGCKMTGYENKKRHLHYYKCQRIGCSNNINVKFCHDKFKEMLHAFHVAPHIIPQLKDQLRITYDSMNQGNKEQEALLLRQSTKVQNKVAIITERFALGEIDREIHDQYKGKYQEEINSINGEIDNTSRTLSNIDLFIDYSITISQNINKIWENGSYTMKQQVQYLVFPEGITFNKKNGTYLTSRVNSVFAYFTGITSISGGIKKEQGGEITPLFACVPGAGIEPA